MRTYRDWRVMGLWRGGRTFLIVVGESRWDCLHRLSEALEEYTYDDLEAMECIWLERWDLGTSLRWPEWVPVEEISLFRFKVIRNSLHGVGSASRDQEFDEDEEDSFLLPVDECEDSLAATIAANLPPCRRGIKGG